MDAWARLAGHVKARREQLGLTQQEAAKRGDLSSATWTKLEAGSQAGYRSLTFARIDTALDWPSGTAAKIVADGRFKPPSDGGRPSDTRRLLQELQDLVDRMSRALEQEPGGGTAPGGESR